jgi:gliding motility-associated-like protein
MKEIGQYFKERFEQFEPNPPSDFWSKIQNDKSLKRFNKMQSFKRFLKFGVTPAAVITIAVLVWVASSQKENAQNQVVEHTPKSKTILSQELPIIEPKQEQTLNTIPENVSPELSNTKKIVDNKLDKKQEPTIEPAKTITEQPNAPIQNKTTTISNKGASTTSNNTIPVILTPKEDPKINFNRNSNVTTKTDPIENITSATDEPVFEDTFDKNDSTEPEEGIDKLLIPNSFTPNGDGINDQFLVKAMWDVEEFELYVYERGGNLVFKSKNIEEGWDGTYLGIEIHSGVYAYFIIYKDSKGNKVKTKGTLNLIR